MEIKYTEHCLYKHSLWSDKDIDTKKVEKAVNKLVKEDLYAILDEVLIEFVFIEQVTEHFANINIYTHITLTNSCVHYLKRKIGSATNRNVEYKRTNNGGHSFKLLIPLT